MKIPIPNAGCGLQLCLKQAGSDLDLLENEVLTSSKLHLHLLRDFGTSVIPKPFLNVIIPGEASRSLSQEW